VTFALSVLLAGDKALSRDKWMFHQRECSIWHSMLIV